MAGVGDGVVEAVGLDARGGLLPGAAGARLVRESAQGLGEVGSWSLERDAQVLAAEAGELRVELGGALAQRTAFGVPCRAVGDAACEFALTLGGRRDFLLGELEALALQRAFGGVHGPAAQHTSRGLLELGDTRPRAVGDALRLGLGEAGGVQLVGEVFGVVADALAKLRELGLQFSDGRARDDGWLGVRGLEVGWAAVALGVDAVKREVLVVALTHGGLEALDRGSLVAQSAGLAGGDLGAVELAVGRGVEDEQLGGFSRARERGVGPVAREVLRATDDTRPLHGASLDGVRGQRVGVLEMLGHVRSVEAALGAAVGAHDEVLLGGVDGDHRAAHAVVDCPLAVVATRDDAIPHGELAARRRGRSRPAGRRA